MTRDYERVLHAEVAEQDRIIPGNVYHIAPANNDADPERCGKSWVWEVTPSGDRLMAGPFGSNDEGRIWLRKLLSPAASGNLGLTYTPPPPRPRREYA